MASLNTLPLPKLDIHGASVRGTRLDRASLVGANLAGANATNASFRGADLAEAKLTGTILRGADLTNALNVTEEQLAEAVIDDRTLLPGYIDRKRVLQLAQRARARTS